MTCGDKWLETCQLGFTSVSAIQKLAIADLYFFQRGKVSKSVVGLFVILKEGIRDAVVMCAFYIEHLDTGEQLIEPAPQNVILGGHHGESKGDTEFLHGG